MTETKQKGKSEPVLETRKVSMKQEIWNYLDEKVEEHKEKLDDRRDLDKLSKEIKDLQQEIRDIEELDSSPDWFVEVTA